jgi:hypothetical protein
MWSTASNIPVSNGANVVALGFGGNVFMASASNEATYISTDGISWSSASDTCQSGYTPSWDTWPNGGKGGFVCNRFVPDFGN